MNKQSLSKNFIFQFMYQGLILIVPLILSPYLTRTLQETAIGIYSYTNSIAYYFVILSLLGISRHGQRIISQSSENSIELRKNFWSLFVVHIIISAIALIFYLIYIGIVVCDDKAIYCIQTFYVMSALFDITWLFYGLENFKSVVIKNAVVKIIECVLIFVFVKSPSDLWKYTLIVTGGVLIGQIVMLPQAIKIVPPIRFTLKDAIKHIRPLLIFSISVIAVSLYTVFDKTLLGLLTNKENVAFYEYSNRIITIPKTMIGVVGTVMFPRACKLASKKDIKGQHVYISYSFLITAFIGIGSIIGLMAVGKTFAIIYFGKSFEICGNLIIALSPLIFIIGIGDIIRTQYMIPNHMDKQFNICIFINAIINILLSISLIPIIGIYGAVIGTVSAELFGIVYQLIVCRRFISLIDIVKDTIPFIVAGIIMFCGIKLIQTCWNVGMLALVAQIIIGIIIYTICSLMCLRIFKKNIWYTLFHAFKRK